MRLHTSIALAALTAVACGTQPTGQVGSGLAPDAGGGNVSIGDAGQVAHGPLVSTRATLALGTFAVGEKAAVTCEGLDAQGRNVPDLSFTLVVEPTTVAKAVELSLEGSAPGQGEVRCATEGVAADAQKPAVFSVTAGPLTRLVAKGPGKDITVGDVAAVTCTGEDAAGNSVPVPGATLVVSEPLKAVAAGGLAVVSAKVGSFPVRCSSTKPALTSEPVDITFVAGKATGVTVTLDPAEIIAGGVGAKATCTFVDDYGNPTSAPDGVAATLDETPDLTVVDGVVTGKKAGSYDLTCTAGALAKTPGKLVVAPGPPAFTKIGLSPDEVEAGKGVQATCTAYDEFGNTAAPQPDDWSVAGPVSCKASAGLVVSCTKSGTQELTCATKVTTDHVPGKLLVRPGPPVSFSLGLDPESDNYSTGQKIGLIPKGEDAFGNAIGDLPLAPITLTPKGGQVDAANAQVWVEQDGLYTVTATLKDYPKFKASRKILSDSSGPLINVSSPKRGHTRLHTSTVTVSFSAADELSPLKSVTLNGKSIKPGSGIGLKAVIPAKQGLNLIHVTAKDKWGNTSNHVQAFYSAKKYNKTETKHGSSALVSNGVEAWLGQKMLDSGKRYHTKPKDIATVIEVVLKNLDVKALLGQSFPVKWGLFSYKVKITAVKFGHPGINKGYPKIKLTAKSGGLGLGATIYKMDADVFADGQNTVSPDLKIDVTATSATIAGTVKATVYSSGTVKAKTENVSVKLHGLDVSLGNSWGFLVNWIIDLFNGTITKTLENTIKEQISTKLDGPLGSMLSAFALDTTFNVPGFFGGLPTPLKMASALSSLTFYGPSGGKPGGARVRMKASLTSARKIGHTVLGSVARRSCLKTYQTYAKLDRSYPMEVALHHDSINQLLAAIWQAGALVLKIDPSTLAGLDLKSYGISDIQVKTDFLLPPVLNDCVADGKPELQLGDIRMDITATMAGKKLVVRAYVSAAAKVDAQATKGPAGKEIALNVGKMATLETDIDQVLLAGQPAGEGTVGFFEKLMPAVTGALVAQLQGTLASIPLPELDLSIMTASIPKGTVLGLDVQGVVSTPGHVQARGAVK